MIKLHGTPAEITAQIELLKKLYGKKTTLKNLNFALWWAKQWLN